MIALCFKEGQPCSSGQAMLQLQLDILNELETNPFESNGTSCAEEAYPTLQLLDFDHEGDSDIEIQTLNVVHTCITRQTIMILSQQKSKTLEL